MDRTPAQRKHILTSPSEPRPSRRRRTKVPPSSDPIPTRAAASVATRQASLTDMDPPSTSDSYLVIAKLKEKVSRLEAELIKEREWSHQTQMRTRQDMYLDLVRERESHDKTRKELKIMKNHHEKEMTKCARTLDVSERKESDERSRRVFAEREAEESRAEVEHLQTLNATFESDLDELRVIVDENANRRADEHCGLPPAYGNLDDEDRFPPYSRHEDGGSLELAHIKREIRHVFTEAESHGLRPMGPAVFSDLSRALYNASVCISNILAAAPGITVSRLHLQSLKPGISASTRLELQQASPELKLDSTQTSTELAALIQKANRATFINDRAAKLIFELLWRVVGACNVRPTTYRMSRRDSASLAICYSRVDAVLAEALQRAFSKKRSLPALQCYLSQLETLAPQFKYLSAGKIPYDFFRQATAWLSDQVEKERELAANPAMARTSYAAEDDYDGSDAASSHWQESDGGESLKDD